MTIRLNNSYFRVSNGYFRSIEPINLPLISIGQVYRVVNYSNNIESFTYVNAFNETVSINNMAPEAIAYIIPKDGTLTDGIRSGSISTEAFAITDLLLSSSVFITLDFTEELISTAGTGTWTKPSGITEVIVECWGGGGSGGGATNNPAAGSGGAGGQYSRKYLQYSSTSVGIPYSVANIRTGGTGNGTVGFDTTWNTNQVVAKGGAGGLADGETGAEVAGGAGSLTGGIGDVVYAGETASPSLASFQQGGFGGRSAGSTNYFPSNTLIGSPEYGGVGGDGAAFTSANGAAGTIFGGGGGGAWTNIATNRNGGQGNQGLIRLIYKSQPILNAYAGANSAYSIRKLSTEATASMRVRRSSDSTELDIGFQPDGMLDTGSLTTFVGANTGYVAKWYDQTGGGYHMTPFSGVVTTWAAIIKSGTLQTENGKPAIRFDGGQAYISQLTTQEYTTAGGLWYQFGVCKVDDASTRVLTKIGNSITIAQAIRRGATSMEAIGYNNAAGTGTDANGVSPGTAQVITYVQRTTTGIEIYMNGTSNGATTVTGTPATEATPSVMVIGAFNPSTLANAWLGSVQEIIHYPQSSVTFDYRTGLTAQLRSYYGTF